MRRPPQDPFARDHKSLCRVERDQRRRDRDEDVPSVRRAQRSFTDSKVHRPRFSLADGRKVERSARDATRVNPFGDERV